MFNLTHPGSILKEDIVPEQEISVTEAATQLGVSRVALSRVTNGSAAISADMAIHFEALTNAPPPKVQCVCKQNKASGKQDKSRAPILNLLK